MSSKKEVQNQGSNSNLKLRIFFLIQQGKSPKDISKILNLKMSALSYHLKSLKASGSIEKIGYGVWKALIFKEKEVQKIKVGHQTSIYNTLNLNLDNRGHAFKFRIKIPKISNWKKRSEFMDKNKIKYELINKGFSHRIIFKGCKTWLSDDSIVVYFPKALSFFGSSAKDSEERAVYEMIEIMKGLETLFKTSFRIRKGFQIKVFGKHQAHIKNGLAKIYNSQGRKLSISDQDGQWLIIDDSFNLNELEAVHPKTATQDMDEVIKPFFNSLKQKPFTAYDFESLFTSVESLAKNGDLYAKNIALHLKTLEEIRDAIKELRRAKDEK